jgi:Flp pilus assembly protein TadD/cytochrome c553
MRILRSLALVAMAFGFAAPARAQERPSYVSAQVCATCHASESYAWQGSHHAQAMQPAMPATVLGDFADAEVKHFGVTTRFFRTGDKFMVRTDGPDGTPLDYEIAYTFGVFPLQQYLIRFPGGRVQALGIAWDSRPKDQGGQHWYPLYPDQKLLPGDPLHWTGRDQTWNYQCADCHSTGLRKSYDLGTNTYDTVWASMDVSCEACHGPGSRHVAWAKDPVAGKVLSDADRMGLINWLKATDTGAWEMNAETGIAKRSEPLISTELDTCAACHSRRKVIVENPAPGAPFLDGYLPAYLEAGRYSADGQIDSEVFEYGSFIQSRMHHAGVTCSNCHEPHGQKLRGEGNAVCAQCHLPAKFDVAAHTHHPAGGPGAQCAACHMPTKTYMGVDNRHDHSIRVPRPDQSTALGLPDACTSCHADKSAEWAATALGRWFPQGRHSLPNYGMALNAGRAGAADAEVQLDRLILDPAQPAIARGSALLLLPRYLTSASQRAIEAAIADPDPLVRAAAPRAMPASLSRPMVQALAPLLADPIRSVRVETARVLAGVDFRLLTPEQQSARGIAYLELIAAEMVDAERPEAHLNLGLFDIRRRQPDEAEAHYRTALRLDPKFVPAMVNLADLDRMRGMDAQGANLLREAMKMEPENPTIRYSLGLLLVRQRDYPGALALLCTASELAPDNSHYAYVYAIALHSTGASDQAITVLQSSHARAPADGNLLTGLVSITRDKGYAGMALRYARELAALYPLDSEVRATVLELEQQQNR